MPDRIQIKEEAKQVLRGARVNPYLVSLIVVGVLGLLGGLGPAPPVVGPLGPQHPHAGLLLKFPGHAIPVLPGGGSHNTFCHSRYPPDLG